MGFLIAVIDLYLFIHTHARAHTHCVALHWGGTNYERKRKSPNQQFSVCYNRVCLTADIVYVTPRNKNYEYIYMRFQEEIERINSFQTSTTMIFKSKPVIAPTPSFWKEASLLLTVFWMYTVYIPTETQEKQGPSSHEKLSRAVDSGADYHYHISLLAWSRMPSMCNGKFIRPPLSF